MSNASRSYQLATGKTAIALGTGVVSSVRTFTRMRWFRRIDSR